MLQLGFYHTVIHPSTRQLVFVGTSCCADPAHKIPSGAQNPPIHLRESNSYRCHQSDAHYCWSGELHSHRQAGLLMPSTCDFRLKCGKSFRGVRGLVTITLEKMWFMQHSASPNEKKRRKDHFFLKFFPLNLDNHSQMFGLRKSWVEVGPRIVTKWLEKIPIRPCWMKTLNSWTVIGTQHQCHFTTNLQKAK